MEREPEYTSVKSSLLAKPVKVAASTSLMETTKFAVPQSTEELIEKKVIELIMLPVITDRLSAG